MAAILLAGCDSAVIEGKVFDARGEALPGVSVRTIDTPYEALTNGRGEYRVRFVPRQEFHVKFFKTGYTTGDLRIQKVVQPRSVTANPISLISLPEGPGVYLTDDRYSDYMRTTFDTPVKFRRKSDDTIVFGTFHPPVETLVRRPYIAVYRGFTIPRFGIKLNRLEETEVLRADDTASKEGKKAWVRAGEVPIDVREVDVGQGQLLSVTLNNDLGPGGYAVHWGALDGDSSLDEPRIFCFKVVEELTPLNDTVELPSEKTKPGQSARKPPAPAPSLSDAPSTPAEDDEG